VPNKLISKKTNKKANIKMQSMTTLNSWQAPKG
jgi:hypothetical protein